MPKIGVKQIAFVEQNKIDDGWEQLEPGVVINDRGNNQIAFSSIDQEDASISEKQTKDENGIYYETKLEFTVRKPADVSLANRYSRRPVVVYVSTVDGNQYVIGTASDPVHMIVENKYNGLRSRELTVELSYKTTTGIL